MIPETTSSTARTAEDQGRRHEHTRNRLTASPQFCLPVARARAATSHAVAKFPRGPRGAGAPKTVNAHLPRAAVRQRTNHGRGGTTDNSALGSVRFGSTLPERPSGESDRSEIRIDCRGLLFDFQGEVRKQPSLPPKFATVIKAIGGCEGDHRGSTDGKAPTRTTRRSPSSAPQASSNGSSRMRRRTARISRRAAGAGRSPSHTTPSLTVRTIPRAGRRTGASRLSCAKARESWRVERDRSWRGCPEPFECRAYLGQLLRERWLTVADSWWMAAVGEFLLRSWWAGKIPRPSRIQAVREELARAATVGGPVRGLTTADEWSDAAACARRDRLGIARPSHSEHVSRRRYETSRRPRHSRSFLRKRPSIDFSRAVAPFDRRWGRPLGQRVLADGPSWNLGRASLRGCVAAPASSKRQRISACTGASACCVKDCAIGMRVERRSGVERHTPRSSRLSSRRIDSMIGRQSHESTRFHVVFSSRRTIRSRPEVVLIGDVGTASVGGSGGVLAPRNARYTVPLGVLTAAGSSGFATVGAMSKPLRNARRGLSPYFTSQAALGKGGECRSARSEAAALGLGDREAKVR